MKPLVPGFIITGELASSATGSTWAAVRSLDDHCFVLKVIPIADPTQVQAVVAQQMAVCSRIENAHVVRQHCAIDLADGTVALVLDQATGGSLAHVLSARGRLTPGETVTTVAPLFRALADLHADGVVHGDLSPASVLFSADGKPMISDLGVALLLGGQAGLFDGAGTEGFVAPELVGGAAASPASDVYAMAALGWLCLAGTPPHPAATRPALTTVRADVPHRLVEVLTSCLATDPAARPSAFAAAAEVFDAAPVESVALVSVSDPAAEITRRIRSAALTAPTLAPSRTLRTKAGYRALVIAVVSLLVAAAIGAGVILFVRSPPTALQAVRSSVTNTVPTNTVPTNTVPTNTVPTKTAPTNTVPTRTLPPKVVSTPSAAARNLTSHGITDVMSAPDSPRLAAAALLQALVDARALAYVARDPALLDLVYAPGAARADVDKANIATALRNGGTYLGLTFVISDVEFLGGTSDTARIRATILTPAYETGQPDGRKVSHAQDILKPCVFSLTLTQDGWRILSLTAP